MLSGYVIPTRPVAPTWNFEPEVITEIFNVRGWRGSPSSYLKAILAIGRRTAPVGVLFFGVQCVSLEKYPVSMSNGTALERCADDFAFAEHIYVPFGLLRICLYWQEVSEQTPVLDVYSGTLCRPRIAMSDRRAQTGVDYQCDIMF
ncbi:uncharacterized protein ARMOST_18606 [Armillaria ostoyae]|uniref:Uncharacterized protein n=1 Tax=Armillaria ostoyae TaxID=47428 RepID=A0A284S285_ARMOS|nr:uncharacterized protein ARMOST_18606 [Armillaria ostoyae]